LIRRVALDVAPVRSQPAGVGLYVARLARELTRIGVPEIALIGMRDEASGLEDAAAHASAVRSFSGRSYHAWLQLAADQQARSTGAQLVHYTNAAAPFVSRLPFVLTVHDLSVARMPRTHPAARWPILAVNVPAIARARAIIVPSAFTARELRRMGVSTRRVTVVPHAPTLSSPEGDAGVEVALRRFGLNRGEYVVSVGTLEPRKNAAGLVAAFERVAAEQPDLKLVLVGATGWHYAGIERRIDDSPARDQIVLTGYLPADEVADLIVGSGTFAYVSLYEGFGMPVLDAMALGAAVVTSRTTSLPEAAGGAAVLVDPRDPDDIARGIREALSRRSELVAAGRQRAEGWTWTDVAAAHIEVYRRALAD
jgi:glycosyltransferase involved in cell wall biosynthesis